MKRTARTAVAALAATVALGVAPSVAEAAPVRDDRPSSSDSHKPGHPDKPGKPDKPDKFVKEQRQVLREIEKADFRLGRTVKESRAFRLGTINGVDTRAGVLANVSADRADLADLADVVKNAKPGFDFRAVRRAVQRLQEENYRAVVNALRKAAKIQAEADALGGVEEVTVAVDAAVAKALAITITSSKYDLKALWVDLKRAQDALPDDEVPGDDGDDEVPGDDGDDDVPGDDGDQPSSPEFGALR